MVIWKNKKLIEDFADIEIKNYFKIKKNNICNPWFDTLDIDCFFNSVWNKEVVIEIKCIEKVKYKY